MTLRLSIENVDRLPDGGPIRIEVKGRGLDLGRDSHLDWSLPDPSRSISGKHCEIRYRDGGYWLHDVSTNGTFVNGADYRLDAPYFLRDGDRLSIGPYIIAVSVEEGRKSRSPPVVAEGAWDAGLDNVWEPVGQAAAPEIGANRQRSQSRDAPPDFLDFASFLEPPKLGPEDAAGFERPEDDWLTAVEACRPPAAGGSGRPRASHTDANAAGDRRHAAETAFGQGAGHCASARNSQPDCSGGWRSNGRFQFPQSGRTGG